MTSSSSNTTDKALEQLTEQIAKLSVNLLEKQSPPPSKPINYSDNKNNNNKGYRSNNNRTQERDSTCYYCSSQGYFAINCRT